jgi:hypothetical protein
MRLKAVLKKQVQELQLDNMFLREQLAKDGMEGEFSICPHHTNLYFLSTASPLHQDSRRWLRLESAEAST